MTESCHTYKHLKSTREGRNKNEVIVKMPCVVVELLALLFTCKYTYVNVAVCCSVLQCVAVCCSVLQCVAVCFSVLQCHAVWCSVVQCVDVELFALLFTCKYTCVCVAVCCSVLSLRSFHCCSPANLRIYVMQWCCSVLHCVAMCCSVLPCVAVCCSALQYDN